jgi:hypothetical protein
MLWLNWHGGCRVKVKVNAGALCFLCLVLAVEARAAVCYVSLSSPSPASPYSSWATAATNIQDAVSAANSGDRILVTNGIYQTGAYNNSGSNRVNINKAIVVQSVNGPSATVIKGYQVPGTTNGPASVRCVYLASGAILAGFTLTGGSISGNGGGIYCESSSAIVSNCVITGNCARDLGGGSYSGWYKNCVISSNVCFYDGGGKRELLWLFHQLSYRRQLHAS